MTKSNSDLPPYVAFYGMTRDPFTSEAEADVFYAEPTRKQRLDVMLHLAEYGNEVMVVIGPRGSGKTALLQQFEKHKHENWVVAPILAREGIDERKFLQQLYHQLNLKFHGATFNELLDYIQKHFMHLHENAQVPIILIDNAEQLPVTALKKVLEMASLTNDDKKPLIRVIMFATENIKEHFKQPQLGHLVNLPMRSLELPPLSEEQTAHYILHRNLAAKFSNKEIFNDATLIKIYRDSYGWPARINEICREILLKSIPSKQDNALPDMDSKSRNPKQLMAAVVTIAIFGIAAAIFYQGNISNLVDKGRDLIASLTNKQMPSQAEVTKSQTEMVKPTSTAKPATTPEPKTLVETLKSRNAAYQETSIDTEPGKTVSSTPVTSPASKSQAQTTAAISNEMDETGLNIHRGNRWILQQNPGHYALQVVAGQSVDTIKDFIERHELKDNIALYRSARKGKPWYGLIYGNYNNKAEAVTAVGQLPKKLQRVDPWIRDFGGVQKDIRKAQTEEPEKQLSLTERLSRPVATRPIATKPEPVVTRIVTNSPEESDIEITRREDWILHQREKHYTLQLMAEDNIATISRYVNRHQLRNSIALYQTTRSDKPLHVLIYGIYPTEELANTAISQLPHYLQQLRPSIRQYSDIHQEIEKTREQ